MNNIINISTPTLKPSDVVSIVALCSSPFNVTTKSDVPPEEDLVLNCGEFKNASERIWSAL